MDLKTQNTIVKQRLHYHFAKTDITWDIPKDMPFMKEFLNEVKHLTELCEGKSVSTGIADVSGSSISMPKSCLKFEDLDNLSIVSESPIPLSNLFELYLKLENYLKMRHETILNNDGLIIGFKI